MRADLVHLDQARTRQDSYAARLPIVSAGIDRLLDSQARIDQEFLARRSTAIGRDDVGIECLKQGDGAGVVAGEGRPDFTGNPCFQPRLDLRTHLGQEVKEQPAADTPRQPEPRVSSIGPGSRVP